MLFSPIFDTATLTVEVLFTIIELGSIDLEQTVPLYCELTVEGFITNVKLMSNNAKPFFIILF